MNYSDKQLKIFETYENTNSNICISAAPGSGKTTTLVEILKRTPPHKRCIFLAFNKSIQMELERKVPENTDALTLHSLGYRTLLKYSHNKYKLSELKNWILGKQILNLGHIKSERDRNIYLFTISRLVDLFRMNLLKNIEDLSNIADKYNISVLNGELTDAMSLIKYLEDYNTIHHDNQMLIDYVDMLWLPYILLNESKFKKYNIVLIDESQDLNKLQFELIKRIMNRRSRFISVGDPYQAIYAFQGADSDVFQSIMKQPNTVNLPLSYTYRCGKNIVEEANKIFNFIEFPAGQHEGEVVHGSIDEAKQSDMIICRNNAPLVDAFLYLLKREKKSIIMGKDYEKGLLSVLNKMEDFTEQSKQQILNNKVEELKKKGIRRPENNQSYQSLLEKIYILEQLHKEFSSVEVLRANIENMFSDKKTEDAIILSTIHKAKGTEADNVFFLLPELIPSKYAETITEQYAEQCLMYVGITRAKNKLIYVHSI